MTIPEAAVEAAAIAIHRVNVLEGAMFELDDYRPDARAALEAAAPHMLAEAWGEGFDTGFYDPLAGGGRDASESAAANPYEAAT